MYTTKKGNNYEFKVVKQIKDFPNNLISKNGNVYSIKYNSTGRLRKRDSLKTKQGYVRISLNYNNKKKAMLIHRIVALHFLGKPEDCNKKIVNHINGIKDDNRLKNLEWTTSSENTQHAYDTGLISKERIKERSKSTVYHLSNPIKSVHKTTGEVIFYTSINEASRRGCNTGSLTRCLRGEVNYHKDRIWSYVDVIEGTNINVNVDLSSYKNEPIIYKRNDPKTSKPVKGTHIKTGKEIVFESTNEAGRSGFEPTTISRCCKGAYGHKSHKGYKWSYVNKK